MSGDFDLDEEEAAYNAALQKGEDEWEEKKLEIISCPFCGERISREYYCNKHICKY